HLQSNCTTRWLDPTQYDWPLDHWNNTSTSWNAAAVKLPLPWKEDLAADVAKDWVKSLGFPSAKAKQHLRVSLDTRLAWPPALHKNRLYLLLHHAGKYYREAVGMVIVAVGSGGEETRVSP